jgi:SAM-dependent methyltransferase
MSHLKIAQVYKDCFDRHGPTHKGVDWPNERDISTRYDKILNLIPVGSSVLDFGCGYGGLLNRIQNRQINLEYTGLDINDNYINYCRSVYHNHRFHLCDVLSDECVLKADFLVLNGVLTAKYDLGQSEMHYLVQRILSICFGMCKVAVIVNFHSPHLDKPNPKLFCPSLDDVAKIAVGFTKKFLIDHSYLDFEQLLVMWRQDVDKVR